MQQIAKPQPGMYRPYSGVYINLVEDNRDVTELQTGFDSMKDFLLSIPEEKLDYRYAEGKWTIKEMLVHMMDTERIFAYRALRIARNDDTPLAGFDQERLVPYSNANERSLEDILEEFTVVRMSTYLLFARLKDDAWDRHTLVDNQPVNARALFYMIIGHPLHHLQVIKNKYL